jgi:hypothetical protein
MWHILVKSNLTRENQKIYMYQILVTSLIFFYKEIPVKISIYSGWYLILHTKGPGKCGGLYMIYGYSGFNLDNRNTLGP